MVCDLDYDNIPEILIGLNDVYMEQKGNYFANYFNYAIGWCVRYDEKTGFTLCEGDMFTDAGSFILNQHDMGIHVRWEELGDIMGYTLEGNKIKPF